MRDGDVWTTVDYRIADLIDAVNAGRYEAAILAQAKGAHQPKPYPRPRDIAARGAHREKSTANAIAYIEKYRDRRGA